MEKEAASVPLSEYVSRSPSIPGCDGSAQIRARRRVLRHFPCLDCLILRCTTGSGRGTPELCCSAGAPRTLLYTKSSWAVLSSSSSSSYMAYGPQCVANVPGRQGCRMLGEFVPAPPVAFVMGLLPPLYHCQTTVLSDPRWCPGQSSMADNDPYLTWGCNVDRVTVPVLVHVGNLYGHCLSKRSCLAPPSDAWIVTA